MTLPKYPGKTELFRAVLVVSQSEGKLESSLAVSQSVSHYEIVRKLGEGGMGAVYQARDTELGRFVALKFFPPHLVNSPERIARFRQEARAISALNHPHIATIYGIEDTGDFRFMALEYLPGGTLAQRLAAQRSTGGKVPLRQALKWAIQMAEGLAHAHKHGIVHRDLKSSNVLFTEEESIKIADFGLAKMSVGGDNDAASLTATGCTVGTPLYMSPEQALGQDVDERSDIFSLGIVLFELITGEVPFRSSNIPAVLHDIVYTPAPSVSQFRSDIPRFLASMIARMLEKEPSARYQAATDIVDQLRAFEAVLDSDTPFKVALQETVTLTSRPLWRRHWRRIAAAAILAAGLLTATTMRDLRHQIAGWTRAPIPTEKRIAVLLFENIGGDASDQALSDGLMEVVSNALTQLEQFHGALLVVPAADVRKEGVTSARDAGKSLGANLALTGSIQRIGARDIQIMINLVDTRTVTQVRTETIRARLPDLAAVQDEVVGKVARMLELAFQPDAAQSRKAGDTTVSGAYPLYVEGLGYLRRYDRPENLASAVSAFRRALAIDSNYVLAYVGLAEAYWRQYDLLKDPQFIDAALENCSRALALNDRLAAAHITMGTIRAGKGQYDLARSEFQAALKLDPLNANAYRELATTYGVMGRNDLAVATYKKAIELRHDDWWSVKQLGVFYFNNGPLEEAERCFREVIRLTPDSAKAYSNLGGTFLKMGRYAEATAQFQKSLSIAPTSDAYNNLGYLYYWERNYEQAAFQFQKATELAPQNAVFWGYLADAYRWAPPPLSAKAPDTYRHAIELAQREISVNPKDGQLRSQIATWWAALGMRKEASSEIAKAISSSGRDGAVQFDAALVYEQAGQRDRSLRAIQSALEAGVQPDEIRKAMPLAALRQDPRYLHLINRVRPQH